MLRSAKAIYRCILPLGQYIYICEETKQSKDSCLRKQRDAFFFLASWLLLIRQSSFSSIEYFSQKLFAPLLDLFNVKEITCYSGTPLIRGARPFNPKFRKFQLVWSNGTDHFSLVRPSLEVVHFDRSGHFGRSHRNVPFHLTKLLSPVPLFCILLSKNNNQTPCGLDRTCATGMYRSFWHAKFRTGIIVEWKAPKATNGNKKVWAHK